MRKTPLTALAAVAATATLALAGCVPGENAGTQGGDGGQWSSGTLSLDFATYNPLSLIIKEQGWIEATLGDDVEVTWTQSLGSNKANEGLRAGALDVGSTAGSAALLARANGVPQQVIAIYTQPEWAALVVAADSDIDEVADLRGKTIAVTIGTDPYFFLLQALDEAGIGIDEVEIQNLQHADGRAALINGTVDAWSGLDPMMADAELSDGARIIYRNIDFNTYGFLNATEDFITNHPDLAQVVVDAYEKAREWALAHPDETAELLAEVAGIDLEVARKVLLERTVIDLDPVPGEVQLSVLRKVAPIQVASGDIQSQRAADDALATIVNDAFAKKADPSRVG